MSRSGSKSTDQDKTLAAVWTEFRSAIKRKYSLIDEVMRLWFDDAVLSLLTNEKAVITTSTNFKKGILETRFMNQISDTFADLLGQPLGSIEIKSVEDEKKTARALENAAKKSDLVKVDITGDGKPDIYTSVGQTQVLNHAAVPNAFDYTFENFVVGKSNQLAAAAANAVSENPATLYNPLFIYGPSGLGKTHLLYAIAGKMSGLFPGARLVYVKGDDFTNQLIQAIADSKTNEFHEKYRSCDVLLIDDIQFIAGKTATQEEFFHTFNALYQNKKQIILASDRPPKDIELLEDRLTTRFESGLMVDINPPDYELRCAIVKKKAQSINLTLPDDVTAYIAENLRSNVRQLEGAVKRISAKHLLTGSEIDLDMAIECISDKITAAESVKVTAKKILSIVSKRYGITQDEIKGKSRRQNIALARHVSCYFMRKYTDMSLPAIGSLLGRDHTTVINSIETVEKRIENDKLFSDELNQISREIKKS